MHEDSSSDSDLSSDNENDENAPVPVNVQDHPDDIDRNRVHKMKENGCGCKMKCHSKLSEMQMYEHILNIREMSKEEKEMYVMGALIDCSDGEVTKRGKKRMRSRNTFTFAGKSVCKKMFMLVFDIGRHCLQNIRKHIDKNGAMPRKHGNTGRKPKHSLKFEDIKMAVQFIDNYSQEFGIPQPAAPRGRDDTAPIFLTASTLKKDVHEKYVESCANSEPPSRHVKLTTFRHIWATCLPHIKIATPRDDVCATCEKLRKTIMDSVTEQEKLDSTNKLQEHILDAQKERDVYNDCVKQAKETSENDIEQRYIHYTFDFSQSVSIPHHSRQMGPLYFASLRKVQIFGFRIDGFPKQLNFLIDENESIGKDGSLVQGPNAVISMIDCALQAYGSDERACALHADNCPGQNKNQYVLGYFMWRVMTGQHDKIEYLMQIPGHARCLVDSGFASLKQMYRRSDCDSIDDLQNVVNKSSSTNVAVRYPSWCWREWKPFLSANFRPVPGIRKFQYFRMESSSPGVVTVKMNKDAAEQKFNILKHGGVRFEQIERPAILQAEGLSHQRQQYLYKTVRQFMDHLDKMPRALHLHNENPNAFQIRI